MFILNYYYKLITSKFLAAYNTPGIIGAVMKIETGVGLLLLPLFFLLTILSIPVNIWVAIFFFVSFLFITYLLHIERMTIIFLGIPYFILLLMRFLDNFIKPKAIDEDYQDFYKMLKMVLTFVLWPILMMLALFIWVYFVFELIDLIIDLLDKLING